MPQSLNEMLHKHWAEKVSCGFVRKSFVRILTKRLCADPHESSSHLLDLSVCAYSRQTVIVRRAASAVHVMLGRYRTKASVIIFDFFMCVCTRQAMSQPRNDMLHMLQAETYKRVRKAIIHSILAMDEKLHASHIAKLRVAQELYQIEEEWPFRQDNPEDMIFLQTSILKVWLVCMFSVRVIFGCEGALFARALQDEGGGALQTQQFRGHFKCRMFLRFFFESCLSARMVWHRVCFRMWWFACRIYHMRIPTVLTTTLLLHDMLSNLCVGARFIFIFGT